MKWQGETWDQWEARAKSEGIRWFAMFPAQMHDGQWVWLEWFISKARSNLRGGLFWDNYRIGDTEAQAEKGYDRPPPPRPKPK